jgi:hypothetical protein
VAKRKPPKQPSYADKYRQIKRSGFKVDIPKPTDAPSKALVTKYHKRLFGGFVTRHGKRIHLQGIARSYKPYKGKHAESINELYRVSGSPRIKAAYYPKEFGHIKRNGKQFITFESDAGSYKILKLNRKKLFRDIAKDLANDEDMSRSIEKALEPFAKGKQIRIFTGATMREQAYDFGSLVDAVALMIEAYSDENQWANIMEHWEFGEFEF